MGANLGLAVCWEVHVGATVTDPCGETAAVLGKIARLEFKTEGPLNLLFGAEYIEREGLTIVATDGEMQREGHFEWAYWPHAHLAMAAAAK